MTDSNDNWAEHDCYKKDPFPDIAPALLNSADIGRYVGEGCLIEPENFHFDRIKPASYEMRFLGELYNWQEVDGKMKQCRRIVSNGDCVTLHKNSISYLWMKERLLLPEYIAARFNLRIREVHKGILLGTGPLIDPGFWGHILIPLHNLTDNGYELIGGDGIIWVEFTKVSTHPYWLPKGAGSTRPTDLVSFPTEKILPDPGSYLKKAGVKLGDGVQSAFKGALQEAQSEARRANKRVARLEKRWRRWGTAGVIVAVVGVCALLISAFALTFPVSGKVHRQSDRIGELERRLEDLLEAQSKDPAITTDDPRYKFEEPTLEVSEPGDSSEKSPELE